MLRILFGFLLTLLISISHAETTSATEDDPQQLFFDVVYEHIADNGEELLCEQEAYAACFKADKVACITSQSAHKADCLEVFNTSRKQQPGTNHTFAFMQCMKTRHVDAAGGSDSEVGQCTDAAMKTFKSSPYSKRIEVVFALTVSDMRIASDLCDQTTLFACPSDTNDSCKARVEKNKGACMKAAKEEVLSTEVVLDESQAAQKYMSCLLISNDCD